MLEHLLSSSQSYYEPMRQKDFNAMIQLSDCIAKTVFIARKIFSITSIDLGLSP